METIIALLFILLPIIFKLIAKRLEKSGKDDTARRVREIARELGVDEDEVPIAQWLKEAEEEEAYLARPEVQAEIEAETKAAVEAQRRMKEEQKKAELLKKLEERKKLEASRKPALVEQPKKQVEKIDPKKLVVYSEIMKPKYNE